MPKLARRTTCTFPDCIEREHARHYCKIHYFRLLGTDALPRLPRVTREQRLHQHTGPPDPRTGCMEWLGSRTKAGYGAFGLGRKNYYYAHRVAWEVENGRPIPDGLQIDHLCRNRGCVNPAHLEPVTNHENQLRSPISIANRNLVKTHCPRGHAYDAENTYVRVAVSGRVCRKCACLLRARKAKKQREVAA